VCVCVCARVCVCVWSSVCVCVWSFVYVHVCSVRYAFERLCLKNPTSLSPSPSLALSLSLCSVPDSDKRLQALWVTCDKMPKHNHDNFRCACMRVCNYLCVCVCV